MVFTKAYLTYSSSPINTSTSNTASPVHLMSLPAILVGILVLVVVAPLLQAQPLIPSGNSNNFEYKRYCSNSLSDVIRLLCGGPYNSQQYAQYNNSGTFSSNSLKHLANDDGVYFRTVQTERIHECCQRPCGYSELKMYCAPI